MVCENNTGSLIFLNIHINILISTYIYFDIDVKVISNPETLTKIDKTSCNFCKEKVSLLFFIDLFVHFFRLFFLCGMLFTSRILQNHSYDIHSLQKKKDYSKDFFKQEDILVLLFFC